MCNISIFLDQRIVKKDGTYPVKFVVNVPGRRFLIGSEFSIPLQLWDDSTKSVYDRAISAALFRERDRMQSVLSDLEAAGVIDFLSFDQIRALARSGGGSPLKDKSVREEPPKPVKKVKPRKKKGDFAAHFRCFGESRPKPKTRQIYKTTLNRIEAYIGREKLETLCFKEINKAWLTDFYNWLSKTCSVNGCSVYMRSIRAVFNDAIDNDITTNYPFRKFRIKTVRTRKRSLSVEKLRELMNYPCEDYQRKYIDYFMLIFYLCGINMIDLANLKRISPDGRIEYIRAKTYRSYSIKVEPEALELIKLYKGKGWLVDILNRQKDYSEFGRRMCQGLQSIGECKRSGLGGKKDITAAFPGLTPYWARHTWATIAASLDIPKETIAAALGHGGNTVTDIYIDFDQRKVDEANRRVLDWVLYGKR